MNAGGEAGSSATLRIAVLGCGRIGSTFASRLSRAGHDITAIARPGSARLAQLRRDGAILEKAGMRTDVRVVERLDEQVCYDLMIVTVLAHQVPAIMPALQRSRASCILFMFNTFDPECLAEAVGAERCAFGMPFVQAVLDGDGRLDAKVGVGGQKTLIGEQRWVDLFRAAGLPAALEQEMPLWLRCHVPLCVAFESVSAAGVRRGGGAPWRTALALARGVHASFGLIEAMGYDLHPSSKRVIRRAPAPTVAAMLWSLSRVRSFRELLATGKAEAAALVDTMMAQAARIGAGVDVSEIEAMRPEWTP